MYYSLWQAIKKKSIERYGKNMLKRYLLLVSVVFLSGCSSIREDRAIDYHPEKHIVQLSNNKQDEITFERETESYHQEEIIHLSSLPLEIEEGYDLPFQDFQQRWNSISTEQGSNLFIKSFEKHAGDHHMPFYEISIAKQLTLRIFVKKAKVISIQMEGTNQSSKDSFEMLTGWSQIFILLNPQIQPSQIDLIFSEMGVGPNGNLQQVVKQSIVYNGTHYHVSSQQNHYLLDVYHSLN